MNVSDLVRQAAERAPDKAALVFHDRVVTWRELDELADAAAAGLAEQGLGAGDRVAVALGNTPVFATTYFGALRGGFVVVPVNTGYRGAEIEHVLADSGARLVVAERHLAPLFRDVALRAGTGTKVVATGAAGAGDGIGSLDDLLDQGRAAGRREPRGGDEDLAVLIYTSGTSGRPKGAMLTHRALLTNLDQCGRIEPPVVTDDDVVLLVLPLFHIYGLNPGLGMVAKCAATGVLVERFDPNETLAEIRRHHVTNVVGAPPMYVAWSMLPDLSEAFASVRLLVSGAAPLAPEVVATILERTGRHVFEGYGLTETAPVLASTLMSEVAKPGSIGRPIPGVELRLLDDDGEPAEDDDPGEIVVRGGNVFSGYWPDGSGGPDAQGWFHTGDVAYADADGDLHLVDRLRELILVSGFNVYPREVEQVLTTHPDVAEAAVIGIPHPYTGESVKALVVRRPGRTPSTDEIVEHCAASLARFKCPTAVEFVDELPHSATGKVSKGRLRELLG